MENTMAGAPIWRRASAVLNGKPSGRRVELDVYITPGQAQQMLDTSLGNRKIRKKDLEMYQSLLTTNQWINTGEPIIMSEPTPQSIIGHLLDGHTRLTACVKSGVGFRSDILFGQAIDSFGRMNCDARTVRDYLHIRGVKNLNKLAAMYNAVHMYKNRSTNIHEHTITLREKVYDWVAENFTSHEIPDHSKIHNAGLRFAGQIAAAVCIIREVNKSQEASANVDRFVSSLCTGVGLDYGDPVLTLRNYLMRTKYAVKGGGGDVTVENMTCVIRAWNAYVSGERLTRLYISEKTRFLLPVSYDKVWRQSNNTTNAD